MWELLKKRCSPMVTAQKTYSRKSPFLGLILLAACSTPHLKPVCPSLVTYSAQDQKVLAAELMQPGDRPQTIRWIGDYIGLRDQVRACAQK